MLLKHILLIAFCAINLNIWGKSANTTPYDTTRFFKVFEKAKRGDTITIVALGGSITKGYNASSEEKRWANQMANWWKITFPNTPIKLINAGIGGTGTDIAVHRVQSDVLAHKPDLVVVEFSVNDTKGDYATTTMEGLIRQLLTDSAQRAVMMLMLKQDDGTTAQESHKIVGNYYKVPMISFADLIDEKIKKDSIELKSIFCDGLHPIDIGMTYIAGFVIDELNAIYKASFTAKAQNIASVLPIPIKGNVFDKTAKYDNRSIEPFQNNGWQKNETGWLANEVGAEIVFKLDGNTLSILYSKHNDTNLGQVEIWVDNEKPQTLNGYWTETWGPATKMAIAAEKLKDGDHLLHIKVIKEQSKGSTGYQFKILNVQKAGNIKLP